MTSLAQTRVIVGMSGGVDSSVAALLLAQRGCDVRGLFMKNWEDDDDATYCAAAADFQDALEVCASLGIALQALNFSVEYRERVFRYFLAELRAGRTPNPDVMCNKEIKFKAFLDAALAQGADSIATGHYARILDTNGQFRLFKASDTDKDQSYFLYTLGQAQLSKTLFPLGELTKPAVRALAAQAGLGTQAKKDSTGICFIGERNFKNFLSRYLPAQPGEIHTVDGTLIGAHEGLMYYTLGQRQGLGIGGRSGDSGAPWYVLRKDVEDNILVVAQGHDHPLLYSRGLRATDLHWITGVAPPAPLSCHAKTRYRQADQGCVITGIDGDNCDVTFDAPQRAVTPGQSIVFYRNEECLGGGVIERTSNAILQ